jgi:hypothetical protein
MWCHGVRKPQSTFSSSAVVRIISFCKKNKKTVTVVDVNMSSDSVIKGEVAPMTKHCDMNAYRGHGSNVPHILTEEKMNTF